MARMVPNVAQCSPLASSLSLSTSTPDMLTYLSSSPLPSRDMNTSSAVRYDIDDEVWADKVDPLTGSVMYVDATTLASASGAATSLQHLHLQQQQQQQYDLRSDSPWTTQDSISSSSLSSSPSLEAAAIGSILNNACVAGGVVSSAAAGGISNSSGVVVGGSGSNLLQHSRSFMETFPSSSPHIPRSASLGSGEAAAHNNISSNSSGVISGGSGRYPGFLDSPSFPTTPVLSSERKKMGSLRRIRKAVKKRRHRTGSMEDLSSSATGSSGPDILELIATPLPPHGSQFGSHGIPLQHHHQHHHHHYYHQHQFAPPSSPLPGPNSYTTSMSMSTPSTPAAPPPSLAAAPPTPLSVVPDQQIVVRVQLLRDSRQGKRCSLESLGIVPEPSLSSRKKFGSLSSLSISKKNDSSSSSSSSRVPNRPVVIMGIAPGSPLDSCKQLLPGDTILAVNGKKTNMENMEDVLVPISGEIQFLIQRRSRNRRRSLTSGIGLAKLVSGSKVSLRKMAQAMVQHPHMLLYLTLDTSENDPLEKEVLYQFPPEKSWEDGALLGLRGVFLTLSDVTSSITGCFVSSSTVVIRGQRLYFSFVQRGKELLLMALPDSVASQYQVELLVQNVERLIRLQFDSLDKAFCSYNTSALNHLFTILFQRLLEDYSPSLQTSLPGITAVPQLKLSSETRVKLSTALSGLDSADHTHRSEILHMQRPYSVMGSCLFYKGRLVCSHLSDSDTCELALFCDSYRLLELTARENITQIIVWKEVWLSSRRKGSDRQQQQQQHDPLYQSNQKSVFMLVTGQGHSLLCMLMERLAVEGEGPDSVPMVDAVYIDRSRKLLGELATQGLVLEGEERGTFLPAITSADMAFSSVCAAESQRQALSESEEEGAAVTVSPRSRPHSLLSKPHFKLRRKTLDPHRQLTLNRFHLPPSSQAYRVVSGSENFLLHYLCLDVGCGLLLGPSSGPTHLGVLHSGLLQCFHHVCPAIRQVLLRRGRGERGGRGGRGGGWEESDDGGSGSSSADESESDKENGIETQVPVSRFPSLPYGGASGVVEHGVLLQSPRESDPTNTNTNTTSGKHHHHHHRLQQQQQQQQHTHSLNYWIVGRLFQESGKELYLCFMEGTSQNLVEVSFKLLFGSSH